MLPIRRVANRGTQTPLFGRLPIPTDLPSTVILVSNLKSGCTIWRSPKPLPLGYLLHYPINILIHIFWLASRDDRPTLLALSRVSKLFHEVCKPLVPLTFMLSRATYIAKLMELGHGTRVELDRQLISLPDIKQIQNLRDEYPSKLAICDEISLYGRPYSSPRPHIKREMCVRETQVESGDSEVPLWAGNSQSSIRRPQPPPQGYLLDYPTDLLTRIFGLACIDDPAAGRSLCLVSKGFYMAMRPVMFHWMQLKRPTQILRLAHLVSIGVAARTGTRRLTIDIPKLGKALLHEELDWSERDGIGSFRWDPSVWGDLDLDSEGSDESESLDEWESSDGYSDTSLSDEEMDIEEDVAFFVSSEGGLSGNLTYGPDGELTQREKWPWDDGLEKAEALVNNATSNIVHAVAPSLRNLELISMDPRLSIALPTFPELSGLTIHVTQLHFLAACSRVLFPVLKYLCIQGKLDKDYIDLDDLIYHAPSITKMRVPFGRDFLRVLIGKLAIPSPHGTTSMDGEGRMFEYVEEICVDHSIDDEADKVFGPDEPLFATWKRVVCLNTVDEQGSAVQMFSTKP